MNSEELLPEWYRHDKQVSTSEEMLKWVILGVLTITTFGLVLMFQSTNEGMKGNN